MKKAHFNDRLRPLCRPELTSRTTEESYVLVSNVPDVKCKHCMKRLGLNSIQFKASSDAARCLISFPNGETVEVLVEKFEMKIENAPMVEPHPDGMPDFVPVAEFIRKPDPISLKMSINRENMNKFLEDVYSKVKFQI